MIKNYEAYTNAKNEFFHNHNSSFSVELISNVKVYNFTDGAQWMENMLNGKVIATENTVSTHFQF